MKIEVYENEFHGGRLLARPRTIEGAERWGNKKCQGGECKCGGLSILINGELPKWDIESGKIIGYSHVEK